MKIIILKLDGEWDSIKPLIIEALMSGLNHFLVPSNLITKVRELGNVTVYSKSAENDPDFLVIASGQEIPPGVNNVVVEFTISSNKDLNKIIEAARGGVESVLISSKTWKVIPLENLIADFQALNSRLLVQVKDITEARLMLETLELGADGVVLTPKSVDEISEIQKLTQKTIKVPLETAKIIEIKEVGLGDRVCVDTCSMLEEGEGMLVGSQSRGLFLVHAEVFDTEFVASRPFRVNASSVSAYVLAPDGKTRYLSELEAGDEVLIANADGCCRIAIVGRVKIEKRPFMLIKAKIEDEIIKILLQNAETIRLVSKDKKAISVAELKEGDEVLVHYKKGGRHFGRLVEEEYIIEK
ncbi:MAG: 3-dehydroquinate synthase II [Candidatus Helarchaeales archaeon]